ncbi:hypothetical protein pb186bvf_005115 [Paramecium bursaria]
MRGKEYKKIQSLQNQIDQLDLSKLHQLNCLRNKFFENLCYSRMQRNCAKLLIFNGKFILPFVVKTQAPSPQFPGVIA